ncbi:plasmid replication protein RepC [Methylorubrum sp. SB2]|uniref:plasmid replication protein RepC n=1 Tax=Methylorubrum subtropicum TaxID=3138812 RepID=UPI00313D1D52
MHPGSQPTTPFGRRPLSLAMMAAQAAAKACPEEAVGHKWRIFRDVTEAKDRLGVSDRALAVLSALLTFHPETTLTPGTETVVFPSNRELSLRAHGPSPATLRRALAQLVEVGLVIRRDSPNGKRYARRDTDGGIAQAFGFDLTPLLVRAAELAGLAQEVRAEARLRTLLREEIALLRRDIVKTLAAAVEADWPGPWPALADRFTELGGMPGRAASAAALQPAAEALRMLRADVDKWLSEATDFTKTHANESQNELHFHNSKPDPALESERCFRGSPAATERSDSDRMRADQRPLPLPMVLEACPDIVLYARDGIRSWADLATVAEIVRPSLGISSSAWEAAVAAMGRDPALVVLAAILQRAAMINAPGGYLRALTQKARSGGFSAWPMLLALWRLRHGAAGAVRRQTG